MSLLWLKKLWLGFGLIAAASSVLLVSDVQQRRASAGSAHRWKLALVQLNNVLDVEETEAGIFRGFEEAGLVRDRDFEITVRNAQGDMATLNSLVDASVGEGVDLLMTLSTPTLQAAIQRAPKAMPIVFTYVSNAFVAGAGTTNEDHLLNVTGVPMVAAYKEMFAGLKQVVPHARRIGTLFVPAEVNMVFNKELLSRLAKEQGLELEAVGVATSTDVSDAALALMSKNIDAVVQIPGNLTAAAFSGIADAAKRARKPVFAFQKVQAKQGASMVYSRDYFDAGREAAQIAVRILRGESPAKIPFKNVETVKVIANPAAAQAIGVRLPEELVVHADEVIKN